MIILQIVSIDDRTVWENNKITEMLFFFNKIEQDKISNGQQQQQQNTKIKNNEFLTKQRQMRFKALQWQKLYWMRCWMSNVEFQRANEYWRNVLTVLISVRIISRHLQMKCLRWHLSMQDIRCADAEFKTLDSRCLDIFAWWNRCLLLLCIRLHTVEFARCGRFSFICTVCHSIRLWCSKSTNTVTYCKTKVKTNKYN